jgi:hypothetical protein
MTACASNLTAGPADRSPDKDSDREHRKWRGGNSIIYLMRIADIGEGRCSAERRTSGRTKTPPVFKNKTISMAASVPAPLLVPANFRPAAALVMPCFSHTGMSCFCGNKPRGNAMGSRLSQALPEYAEEWIDERSMKPPLHPSERDRLRTERWTVRRQVAATAFRIIMILCAGAAAALAWQSYGNAARGVVASWSPWLDWLAPPAVHAAPSQPGPSISVSSASSDQLAAISRSLVAVRQSVDKIAADVARLQAGAQPPPAVRTSASPPTGGAGRRATLAAQAPASR